MLREKIYQAIKLFEERERAKEVIEKVFKHSLVKEELSRVKGPYYELGGALKFETKEGHFIQEFSRKFFNHIENRTNEHDFVTNTYLGECKNVHWESVLKARDKIPQINKFQKQINDLISNAKILSKKPILLNRYPFPEELLSLHQDILSGGVEVRNGY